MLTLSSTGHQTSFFGTDLLLQLDVSDPLIQLSHVIPWSEFEEAFAQHYSKDTGVPSKPIRLMVVCCHLSDERIAPQFKHNPYY